MLRSSSCLLLGYTAVNPDTSPMVMYSNYHWHYNLPQGMERPHSVNRQLPAPFQSMHRNVNRYRSVWIGGGESRTHPEGTARSSARMPLAYQVALDSVLRKLPRGRQVPSTPVEDVVSDYERVSPRLHEPVVRDLWLSRLLQHCAFHRAGEVGLKLWETHAAPRYMSSSLPGALGSSTPSPQPPLPLVKAMLLLCCKCDLPQWKAVFKRCQRPPQWNLTPLFETAMWSFLLKTAGRQGDAAGVQLLLEEMLDVKADLDRVEARSLVYALNAVDTSKDEAIYAFIKSFLFQLGERKVKFLRITYANLRGHGASKLRVPLTPNDNMFYHVCWHESVRLPRTFNPRQLYFDYTPTTIVGGAQDPNGKIDDIVKDKIEKWKSEGLLPEDYVHEDRVYDKAAAFKNVSRQEKWKKVPRIVKSRRFGYTGD